MHSFLSLLRFSRVICTTLLPIAAGDCLTSYHIACPDFVFSLNIGENDSQYVVHSEYAIKHVFRSEEHDPSSEDTIGANERFWLLVRCACCTSVSVMVKHQASRSDFDLQIGSQMPLHFVAAALGYIFADLYGSCLDTCLQHTGFGVRSSISWIPV